MRRALMTSLALWMVLALAACGSDPATTPNDDGSGSDRGGDVAELPPADADAEVAPDAGRDALDDKGQDGAVDDATPPVEVRDPGPDATEDPGSEAIGDRGPDTADANDPDVVADRGPDGIEDPGSDAIQDPGPDGTAIDTPGTDGPIDVKPVDVPPELPPLCTLNGPCDDGNPCTTGETCDATGHCVGGTVYACDDHRDCTDDTCDGKGNCRYTVREDACLVYGICRASGEVDPDNPCKACDPAVARNVFSEAAEDADCDPSASLPPCQIALGGTCQAGVCVVTGETITNPCDDASPCTADSCDLATGLCVQAPLSGQACVLGDKCKPGTCVRGECMIPASEEPLCDDGNSCTRDTCDPLNGCLHEPQSEIPCDDDNACTVEDACFGGTCAGIPANIDDGNVCTLDGCEIRSGPWHDPTDNTCCDQGVSKCDDGNPCTNDDCDPTTLECINTPNTAACNDGNACTVNDSCQVGYCAGVSKNCGDGNDCTQDRCEAGKCIHTPQDSLGCDDGEDCSTDDHCVGGQCVADLSNCDQCEYSFAPAVSKFITMEMAQTGNTGDGLNLDEIAGTCSPAPVDPADPATCCCGVDNSLGPLAGIKEAQDGIKKAMDDDKIILLFEHRNLRTDGGAYTLAFYAGKLDPANASCDSLIQDCKYLVDRSIFKDYPDCGPLVTLDNAKIIGNKLTAGGKNYRFPFDLPLMEGINLHVDLYFTKLEATVLVSGGKVLTMSGLLGGAVPKQQIIDAVNAIDPWPIKEFSRDLVLMMIGEGDEGLVYPDIDGDGDGVRESASIGIKFTAIPGSITGVY